MVRPDRLNRVEGNERLTNRLESDNSQGNRSRPIETSNSRMRVTNPSFVAFAKTVLISTAPTSTQADIASVNGSAGGKRLKISVAMSAATTSAIKPGSIRPRSITFSAQNTHSFGDTKSPKSGYPAASPISSAAIGGVLWIWLNGLRLCFIQPTGGLNACLYHPRCHRLRTRQSLL